MGKTWVPCYLSMKEGFKFFVDTEVMAVCLRDAEMVAHDRSFFMDFVFVCGKAR